MPFCPLIVNQVKQIVTRRLHVFRMRRRTDYFNFLHGAGPASN